MSLPVDLEAGSRSRRRRDLVYGAHLALVAVLGIGRTLRAIENASPSSEAAFSASATGRALALFAMVVGMSALAAVVVLTARERRDGKALLLLALLAGAMASRRSPDALDLLYAAFVVALAALWFLSGRRARPVPDGSSGAVAGRPEPPRG